MFRLSCGAVLALAGFLLSAPALAANLSLVVDGPELDGAFEHEDQKQWIRERIEFEGDECVPYWVSIVTGDVANGGTDGAVRLAVDGAHGSTGLVAMDSREWQFPSGSAESGHCKGMATVLQDEDNPSDNFEAGSTELYVILGYDVGDVTGATVRMDAAGTAGSGWMLQSVHIEKGVRVPGGWRRSGAPLSANFNNWIESGKEQPLTENSGETSDYTFTFQTGTDSGAGTDADITIRLEGVNFRGKTVSFERVINPFLSGNAFENGQRDTATIKGLPAIERLRSLTVTTADNYAGSAWQLSSVDISSPALCGGEAGAECRFGAVENFSFGNVWLGGDTLSASERVRSLDTDEKPLGAGASQDQLCYRMAAKLDFDEAVSARVCTRTKDAIRDLACVLMAKRFGEGDLNAWAGKCVSDPNGASAELWAIHDRRKAAETPGPAPEPTPGAAPDPAPERAAPAPEAGPSAPAPVGSEEKRCMGMVDGRVAYDRSGSKAWNPENIAALCAGATDADARIACFEGRIAAGERWDHAIDACAADDSAAPPSMGPPAPDSGPSSGGSSEEQRCRSMVDGRVAWDQNGSTDWNPGNIAALCAGATDADARIACFQGRIAAGESWDTAIPACAADGGGGRAQPPAGVSAEAARCKALLQDQVPWQIDPPERHWAEEDLDALCDGSTNAAATVRCFQDRLWNNGNQSDIQTAIAACRED